MERVESSKIQKWHSLDSLEFSLLCFERVPSTHRVFLNDEDEHKLAEQTLDALLDEDSNLSPVKPMRQG